MKLRSKAAIVRFRLTDSETGRTWEVDPSQQLVEAQVRKMAGHPFMILQYAHQLADLASQPDRPRVEVRALALASLNGHPAEPLVDPKVDLAAVPRRLFGPTDWILPQNNELGRQLRATQLGPTGRVRSHGDLSVE